MHETISSQPTNLTGIAGLKKKKKSCSKKVQEVKVWMALFYDNNVDKVSLKVQFVFYILTSSVKVGLTIRIKQKKVLKNDK